METVINALKVSLSWTASVPPELTKLKGLVQISLTFTLKFTLASWCVSRADGERCERSPARRGSALRHVRPQQRQADRGRDAELPGDRRLLHQRGDSGS